MAWEYWECGGAGDSCQANCGEGKRTEGSFKECDDDNLVGGDGCGASCQIECTNFTNHHRHVTVLTQGATRTQACSLAACPRDPGGGAQSGAL